MVDRELLLLGLLAGELDGGQPLEAAGLTELGTLAPGLEGHVQLGEPHGEGGDVALLSERAEVEGVEGACSGRPRLALLDDDLPAPAEQVTAGEGDDHTQQGKVEEQVAGLFQIPLLPRDPQVPVLGVPQPVALGLQRRAGCCQGRRSVARDCCLGAGR